MEKNTITYKGISYPVREIDLSPILADYGVVMVADYELSKALEENDYDEEGTEIDEEIYHYMDSGVIASNPTDAELLLRLADVESIDVTDQQWYNLMRLAAFGVNILHEEHHTNLNMEAYECGGEYSVYVYRDGLNRNIYYGKSAEMAARTAIAVGGTIDILENKYNH